MIGAVLAMPFMGLLFSSLHMRKSQGIPLALAFVPCRIPVLQRLHTAQSQLRPRLRHYETDHHAI
jgi:hypothetical protein